MLTAHQCTFFSALTLLLIQLSTLQPWMLPLPTFTYGATATAHEPVLKVRTITPTSVELVRSEPKRDAVLFVGDVLLARNVEFLMRREGADYPYRGIDFTSLARRPYVVANFEASIPTEHQPTPIRMIDFSVAEEFITEFKRAGFTHTSLANNHTWDFGGDEFINTKTVLEQHGIATFGHPHEFTTNAISFVEVSNKKVALIALHALERLPSVTEIMHVMRYANNRSDVQVVFVHWGNEYETTHSSRQRDLAERLIDAGVDAVIGHHPHVVQGIERIDGVPVIYSLGNYIFDQYDDRETQLGLLVALLMTDSPSLLLYPVSSIGSLSQPHLPSTKEHFQFLTAIAERSDETLREEILNGVLPLKTMVATSAKIAMMSQ